MQLEGRVIGLIEDDPIMGESLVQSLTLEGCRVDWWTSKRDAGKGLRRSPHDLIICDIRLPDGRGDELFFDLAATEELPPFLFVTAFADIDQAVAILRAGAGDYITKPFEMSAFLARAKSLLLQSRVLKSESTLGASEAIRTIEGMLQKICDATTPVLFAGETGVGKEVCARLLHSLSTRSKEPFIAVNCAAIPGDVMERELFGCRGSSGQAFHHGFAERTRGGVLFLDEVSELALPLQAKLLRLVEAREYHRIGGEQQMQFRGRIVCSTNRDLVTLVDAEKFRADLYYRINAVTVEIPPLRSRPEDIPWLIAKFMDQFVQQDSKGPRGMSTLAQEIAIGHHWPGNVRELRNRVERAVALTKTEWIMPSDLFPDRVSSSSGSGSFASLSETRDDAERRHIQRALAQTKGHIFEAAQLLGVSRTTLWEKMRRLGIASQAH